MNETSELHSLREQVQRQQASLEAMRQLLVAAIMYHPERARVRRVFLQRCADKQAQMLDDEYRHLLADHLDRAVGAISKQIAFPGDP